MSDDLLKSFLKSNASPTPEGPLGESSRIWRKMQTPVGRRVWWFSLAPLLAAGLAGMVVLQVHWERSEARVEEEYLQEEWAAMMADVDSDVESEMISAFEK